MTTDQRTLAEQAFESVYSLILSGELPLGGIVNEVALSQRFNISRGPIREALQRLQGLKLVTREPYMRARVVSLAPKDLIEIFQLREAAEGMACRLAAEAMQQTDLDEIDRRLNRAAPQTEAVGETFDLHVSIAERCGNERIRALLCEELYHLLRIYRRRSGATPGRHDQAAEEHWQIVRALRMRDGALAESLMRSHINRATQSLIGVLERHGSLFPDDIGAAVAPGS